MLYKLGMLITIPVQLEPCEHHTIEELKAEFDRAMQSFLASPEASAIRLELFEAFKCHAENLGKDLVHEDRN